MLHSNGLGRRLGCVALVMGAVTTSGYPVQAAVGTQRRKPSNLAQDSAVRFDVEASGPDPGAHPGPRERTAVSVTAMRPEEALYWYALTTSGNAPRPPNPCAFSSPTSKLRESRITRECSMSLVRSSNLVTLSPVV